MSFLKAIAYVVLFALGFIVYTVLLPFSPKKATAFEVKFTNFLDEKL